jgi:hypothetical protein
MFHNHIAHLAIILFYIYFNFQILRKKSRSRYIFLYIQRQQSAVNTMFISGFKDFYLRNNLDNTRIYHAEF